MTHPFPTLRLSVLLGQFGRRDRAERRRQRRRHRPPVHQIAAVPDDDAGIGIEGREGDVIIVAVAPDAGIGMIAGENGIEEGAVTQIGAALPLETLAPVPVRIRIERSEEHTSELQSLMRSSYAVLCLKKKIQKE